MTGSSLFSYDIEKSHCVAMCISAEGLGTVRSILMLSNLCKLNTGSIVKDMTSRISAEVQTLAKSVLQHLSFSDGDSILSMYITDKILQV